MVKKKKKKYETNLQEGIDYLLDDQRANNYGIAWKYLRIVFI